MSQPPSYLLDSDLHALVDGLIEPDRRSDALRRLATSPSDRARVESWQNQNDLLRSAFAGIAREALPPMLDLRVRPRLHCIPPGETVAAPAEIAEEAKTATAQRWLLALLLTLSVAGIGFGGWRYFASSADAPAALETSPIDSVLALRAEDALTRTGPVPAANPQLMKSLPARHIPDLSAAGFSFVGAEAEGHMPPSILFRYQNEYGERLVIGAGALGLTPSAGALGPTPSAGALGPTPSAGALGPTPSAGALGPTPSAGDAGQAGLAPRAIGASYVWHQGERAYAIAGNLRAARLRALAISLFSAGE